MLGLARAEAEPGSELDGLLLDLERDLWVLMAEVATAPENRHKLVEGASLVTDAMVSALEVRIDALNERFEMPNEFVVPGQNRVSAALDVARTVVRRAERGFTGASPDAGLACRALSQPALGPVVDHGALAGGRAHRVALAGPGTGWPRRGRGRWRWRGVSPGRGLHPLRAARGRLGRRRRSRLRGRRRRCGRWPVGPVRRGRGGRSRGRDARRSRRWRRVFPARWS